MSHVALIAPPFPSHIRVFEALAEALALRGHRATFLHQPDVASLIRSEAMGFHALGQATYPPGALAVTNRRAARPGGPFGLLRLIHDVSRATDMLCREAPAALRGIGADLVIADQAEPAGGLVAEALGLPFVSVAAALPINREPDIPLPVLSWPYDPTPRGRKRNRGGAWVGDLLLTEQRRVIARHGGRFGLGGKRDPADCLSPFAQISQTVAGFDFPRLRLPPQFHHLGPLRGATLNVEAQPLEISPHRPFVFASLGTLQGGRASLFRAIAKACRALDVQLLVAHCGGLDARQAAALGATWVTDFAPQRAVLARATLAVTHAGLNTVLDALAFGVPMLALPIAFDQPGVAARIVHAGVGERLAPRRATAGRIRMALERLLTGFAYREKAAALRDEIAGSGGVQLGTDIIEELLRTRRPVPSRR